jgi:hypothetical protein
MTTIIRDAGSAEIATEKVLRMHFYGLEPQVEWIRDSVFAASRHVTVLTEQAAKQPCGGT